MKRVPYLRGGSGLRSGLGLTLGLLLASSVASAELDDGGCVFNRRVFPEGYEMCQSGKLKRCESGAWGDIGRCDSEAMPPPIDGGGDVVEESER